MRKYTKKDLMTLIGKQCEMVGANSDEVDFKEEGWYNKHTWTKEEEDEFRDWAIAWLRKNLKWPKWRAQKEMEWYLLMWGWKYKDV